MPEVAYGDKDFDDLRMFSMRTYLPLILIVTLGATGCAGLKLQNIASDADDQKARGFRYYDTAPFLLIYTDSKGGLKSEILYLPDTRKMRSIRPYSYGASNDVTLSFQSGRLIKADAAIDETALPGAAVAGLEQIATSAVKAANAGSDEIPGPYLFRIRKDGNDWKLDGGQALDKSGNPSVIRYLAK